MAEREMFVKTLITNPVFAIKLQRWDNQNYPYWNVEARYETAAQARENLPKSGVFEIVTQRLHVTSTGRLVWADGYIVLNKDGKWHPECDPRAKDPRWKEYLKLKEIFDE